MKFNKILDAYRLWWTCETVLITSPWNWLISMSFDQVGNWIVRAFAMHDLLSGVVRVHDVSPSNITKIFALSELFHRFTDLWKKDKQIVKIGSNQREPSWDVLTYFVLSVSVWNGVPILHMDWSGTWVHARGASALLFDPWTTVCVYFIANAVRATNR